MRRKLVGDRAIAELAGRQGGVIARGQLLGLGLSGAGVDRRVRLGRLHPLHRGVYSVGHRAIGVAGRRWAAVLACAPGAVVSHASAAAAWDLRASGAGAIHVTVGPGGRARRPEIRIHRTDRLYASEVTLLDGLPVTSPARTLLDLAAGGSGVEAALDRAEQLRLVDFAELERLVALHAGRRGARTLADAVRRYEGPTGTRSVLEARFLALCEAHRLPRPRVNTVVAGRERDFTWPGARLVVELDSYAWHRSPAALVADRERDTRLVLAGYRVLRFTWPDVTRRPEYVVAAVRSVLATS